MRARDFSGAYPAARTIHITKRRGCVIAKGKYQEWLTEDGLLCIEGWARDGLTDVQIAYNMGVSPRRYYEWQNRFPQIRQALKKGKAPVDLQVKNALLKRALGYSYVETVTDFELVDTGQKDDSGKPVMEKRIRNVRSIKKEMAPDVGAAAFWLKNRRPDRWREKREEQIQVTGADYSLLDEVRRQTDDNDR